MFDSGTRVIVLASSHRGSSGVKKGSLAFYNKSVSGDHIVFDSDLNIFYFAAELVFTRYGFEKKTRCEKKRVIVVLPKIQKTYGDTYGQIAKLSRRIQSGRPEQWNNCRKYLDVTSRTPIIMLAPASRDVANLKNADGKIVEAWVESILTTEDMMHWIVEAVSKQHISTSTHPTLHVDHMYFLRELVGNKDNRTAALVQAQGDYKSIIEVIQLANIIQKRASRQDQIQYDRHRARNERPYRVYDGKTVDEVKVCCCAYLRLFQTHLYDPIKEYMCAHISMNIHGMLEEPDTVRACLLGLSACLERTGKIDGKKAMIVGQ